MRTRAVALAGLLPAVLLGAPGCVGSVSRSDGEGPLPPSLTREVGSFDEVGGGAGGLILKARGSSRYLLATSRAVIPLEADGLTPDLAGARLAGTGVYSLHGDEVVRRERTSGWLAKPTVVARVPGARSLAVMAADVAALTSADTLLVARPGEVLAGPAGGSLETLWRGEALALDLDPVRAAAWIVGSAPVPTIDCVALEDARVLCRAPLPVELESAGVRLVRSGRAVVVYAVDRPIEAAIVLSPETGVARRLLEVEGLADVRGSYDDASLPPLLVPPGRFEDERLSVGLPVPAAQHRGRVACLGSGRFAVIDDRASSSGFTVDVVTAPERPDGAPLRSSYAAPEPWPRAVEGVGWDEGGAFLTCGDRRLVLGAGSAELEEPHPVGDALRRGTNHVVNGVLVVGEVGGSVVLVAGALGVALAALPVVVVVAPFVVAGQEIAKASH